MIHQISLKKAWNCQRKNIYHGGLVNYSFSSTLSDENLPRHLQVAKQFLAEYDKQHQVSINVSEVSIKKSDEGKDDKSMETKQEWSLQSCENESAQVPTEGECIHEEQMSSDGELFLEDNSSSLEVEQDTRNSDAQGFEVEGFEGDEPSTCILPKSNDDSQVSESTISVIPEMQMTPDEVGKTDK